MNLLKNQDGFVPIPVIAYILMVFVAVVSGWLGYKIGDGKLWITALVFGGGIIIGYKLKNFLIDILQNKTRQ